MNKTKLILSLTSLVLLMVTAVLLFIFCYYKDYYGNAITSATMELDGKKTLFEMFKKKYGKEYKTQKEYEMRFEIFKKSLERIEELNNMANGLTTYGITKFSDVTKEEFQQKMLLKETRSIEELGSTCPKEKSCDPDLNDDDESSHFLTDEAPPLPAKFDWRDEKVQVIGPVLDQGDCNSCWAICIVGVIEAMAVITNKVPYAQLSVQELIDMWPKHCIIGNMETAANKLCTKQYPVNYENEYPPLQQEGWTLKHMSIDCNVTADKMMNLIYRHGPFLAQVNAYHWSEYIDGIIHYHCPATPDSLTHVVQVIGYDTTNIIPYFIAKNSWGRNFGENGYVKIAMKDHLCGLGMRIMHLDVRYKNTSSLEPVSSRDVPIFEV